LLQWSKWVKLPIDLRQMADAVERRQKQSDLFAVAIDRSGVPAGTLQLIN
jgi:hypothetical protein